MTAAAVAPIVEPLRLTRPTERDVEAISHLNNLFVADGLTLPRSPAFVEQHLADYRIARDAEGRVLGCVAVDEYAPSLAELVSLAVSPDAQGRGLGSRLIGAAIALARVRGYDELFAVSFADQLFLAQGFAASTIDVYPEKKARYAKISRSEIAMAKKFCFRLALLGTERGA